MYTYEYETVYVKGGFIHAKTLAYQDAIDRRAKDGWRYVGFIPTKQSGHGIIDEMDLIFEKEM